MSSLVSAAVPILIVRLAALSPMLIVPVPPLTLKAVLLVVLPKLMTLALVVPIAIVEAAPVSSANLEKPISVWGGSRNRASTCAKP